MKTAASLAILLFMCFTSQAQVAGQRIMDMTPHLGSATGYWIPIASTNINRRFDLARLDNEIDSLAVSNGTLQVYKQKVLAYTLTLPTGSGSTTLSPGSVTNTHLASGIDAVKIGFGTVGNTEFSFLDQVTSGIQNQINGKASLSSPTFTNPIANTQPPGSINTLLATTAFADAAAKRIVRDSMPTTVIRGINGIIVTYKRAVFAVNPDTATISSGALTASAPLGTSSTARYIDHADGVYTVDPGKGMWQFIIFSVPETGASAIALPSPERSRNGMLIEVVYSDNQHRYIYSTEKKKWFKIE